MVPPLDLGDVSSHINTKWKKDSSSRKILGCYYKKNGRKTLGKTK